MSINCDGMWRQNEEKNRAIGCGHKKILMSLGCETKLRKKIEADFLQGVEGCKVSFEKKLHYI